MAATAVGASVPWNGDPFGSPALPLPTRPRLNEPRLKEPRLKEILRERWGRTAHRWEQVIVGPLLRMDRATTETGRPGRRRSAAPLDRPRTSEEILACDPAMQLQALVEDHSEAVYRVALSVVRDAVLAEDISQDALLKAWTALPTFRGDSPLRNWVLRITHNTAVSVLRTRREELREPDELPDRANLRTVERGVEDKLALTAFESALERLDDLSRSIVVLREIEHMSYDEIAEVLDVPLPTVKTRLLRARRVLSDALEGWRQ